MSIIDRLLHRDTLPARAHRFRKKLVRARRSIKTPPDWYPYDSLVNLYPIQDLLSAARVTLSEICGPSDPVLDIGCGDGDLAFFLESLGLQVHAIDNPPTNYNRLEGVRALKQSLDSGVQIHECDLDARFELPDGKFRTAFFLGILYHLKNPFYALETLAHSVRYCFVSTRVARRATDGTAIAHLPVSYLLDPAEANNDSTNYWIFTTLGLLRLVDRAGWDVRASVHTGDVEASDPAHSNHDERAFLLLESRLSEKPPGDSAGQ